MTKAKREASKKAKTERKEKRQKRKAGKGMIKVTVQLCCGCCHEEMEFSSVESANAAFNKAGLTNSGSITDDTGKTIDAVDTFYGFCLNDEETEEMKNRPLARLAKLTGLF